MTRRHISSKWKVIICCIALIAVMASTGITVWAIARNYFRYNADFEVNITGGRFVNASVRGQSFLAGSSEALESHTTTFNANTANETSSMSFDTPITMQNDEQVAKLRFEVTNNSPYSNHSDLIVKPLDTIADQDDVIITWYYSTNNTNFYVHTGEYLVAHKGDTLYLELRMLATQDLFGTANFDGNISIDMYSEMQQPADFEYDHEITYSETNPYTTKKCPTCGHAAEIEYLDAEDIIIIDDTYKDNVGNYYYTGDIDNKYVFLELMSAGVEVYFTGKLTNVTISTLVALQGSRINIPENSANITFRQIPFNTNSAGPNVIYAPNCTNIKIIDCIFTNCMEIGSFHGVTNLTIKDCTISSDDEIEYVFDGVEDLRCEKMSLAGGAKLKFNNITNLILSKLSSYHPVLYGSISGYIYIVNNESYSGHNIFSLNDAFVYIKNNTYETSSAYVTINESTNTVIEICNNHNSMGDEIASIHKINKSTNIATATEFCKFVS